MTDTTSLAIALGAALACGLMIGVERGWRLRNERPGTRVAGVRTYALLGAGGGLSGILATLISPAIASLIVLALSAGLVFGYWRDPQQRDATSFVAATVVIGLGLLAGAGRPQLAVAGAAVTTLLLATREHSHRFVERLSQEDVHAFARYAVIAGAVLPFLPNRSMGPLGAWNPFQLWLVVVLVTGFSFAGYIANRTIGARKGVLAMAVIGGAYSSTAVTASLSRRLGRGEPGPFAAGIILASAVMYARVGVLVALLSPSTLPQFLLTVGPAALVGALAALFAWVRAPVTTAEASDVPGNPIELLPAFGFVAIVALAAVFARWAQMRYGQSGIATSLLVTGMLDVDAAIVTLSGLPQDAIDRWIAAVALSGTIIANMAVKMLVIGLYARRKGLQAMLALGASTAVLIATVGWQLILE